MVSKKTSNILSYIKILSKSRRKVLKDISDWDKSISKPTEFYLDAFRFFYFYLPSKIKDHKSYFNKHSRGFGEKAFHSMWFILYKKFQFNNFLEIGIYRGQTISLLALIAQLHNKEIEINGISPFDNSGDSVSQYLKIDYKDDVLNNFTAFALPTPFLTKAYSTDVEAIKVITYRQWDCIYIDGSHDYEIAKKDWLICSENIKKGGIIVMDDSSLYTDYEPPFFAFKGHPGPSRVVKEIIKVDERFKEILRVGHNRVFQRN